ncbi:MAG: hypothetical protein GX361_06985 [Bacteroidales bacterium]|nr:hypothetical protein [Bacteroidales bacterium]
MLYHIVESNSNSHTKTPARADIYPCVARQSKKKHASKYVYSSAIDYAGGKGLLDIILIE